MECVEWEERARVADPSHAVRRRRSRTVVRTSALAAIAFAAMVVGTVLTGG